MSCSSGDGGDVSPSYSPSPSTNPNTSTSTGTRTGTRRTRGGCVNCKKRKRKCDEQRPECLACTSRNMKCGGYAHPVRWVEGIASRGRFVGVVHPGVETQKVIRQNIVEYNNTLTPSMLASIPTTAAPATPATPAAAAAPLPTTTSPSPSPSLPQNSTTAPPHDDSPALPESPESHPGPDVDPPPLPTDVHGQDNAHDSISDEERAAYRKFLVDGLHKLCNAEIYAWLAVFFEASAQQSRALPLVGAAVQTYLDDGWSITALERLDRAISTFRADLSLLGTERRLATICSGLFICTMCLYQNKPISPYLCLLADMHDLNGNLSGLQPDPRVDVPTQHILEVLGVMDMPSFLVGRIYPSIGIWKCVRRLRSERSDLVLGQVEPVTGMPRSLLDIFADFADPEHALKGAEAQFWTWPGCKGTFDQCHLWDAWRFAGILDARRRLRQRESHVALESSTSCAPVVRQDNEPVLCRLMALFDVLIRKLQSVDRLEPALLTKALVYPFAMASLEISLLSVNQSWVSTLREFRSVFFRDGNMIAVHERLFTLLDQAWELDDASFDIDRAVRALDLEIGMF